MTIWSFATRTVVPAISGALAGLLGAGFLVRSGTSSHTRENAETATAAEKVVKASLPPIATPPSWVAPPQPIPAPVAESPARHQPQDEKREEARQRDFNEFHARLAMHEQEPVDRAWSAKMESTVSSGLDRTKHNGRFSAEVTNISCRSVSCVAEFSWPSVVQASKEYDSLVTLSGEGIPCSRTMTLEDDLTGGGQYSAKMYMDCTDTKLGTVSGK